MTGQVRQLGNWIDGIMDSLTYTQLLRRNRSFRRLWIGQVISELGNWFNFIAALGIGPCCVSRCARSHHDRSHRATRAVHTLCSARRRVRRSLVASHRNDRDRPRARGDRAWVPARATVRRICGSHTCALRLLSFFGTFFEAAKNAAVPNITGERDLLAGNALMFSSRFLLMSLGAALGGWTAAHVGYQGRVHHQRALIFRVGVFRLARA